MMAYGKMKIYSLGKSQSGYIYNFSLWTATITTFNKLCYYDELLSTSIVLDIGFSLLDKAYQFFLDDSFRLIWAIARQKVGKPRGKIIQPKLKTQELK